MLEKEIQISILKGAVNKLKYDTEFWGCCNAIIVSAETLHGIETLCSQLQFLFPSFTREKALSLSKDNRFQKPNFNDGFWWKCGSNRQTRIKFLNALISELENE